VLIGRYLAKTVSRLRQVSIAKEELVVAGAVLLLALYPDSLSILQGAVETAEYAYSWLRKKLSLAEGKESG